MLIRESNRFVYLLATLPLPATREILMGLDDGAQACPRVIVLALDPKCNTPHEIFGRLYALGGCPGMLNRLPVKRGRRASAKRVLAGCGAINLLIP